jgi:hypothetical protein
MSMILEIVDPGVGPLPGPEGGRCCFWIRSSYG